MVMGQASSSQEAFAELGYPALLRILPNSCLSWAACSVLTGCSAPRLGLGLPRALIHLEEPVQGLALLLTVLDIKQAWNIHMQSSLSTRHHIQRSLHNALKSLNPCSSWAVLKAAKAHNKFIRGARVRGGRWEVLAGHLNLSSPILGQALIYPIWDVDNYAGSKLSLRWWCLQIPRAKQGVGVFILKKPQKLHYYKGTWLNR